MMKLDNMTIEQLETLIKNARNILDKKSDDDKALKVITDAENIIGAKMRNKEKRPHINYVLCGLKIGDRIRFAPAPDEVIEVYTGRTLKHGNEPDVYITNLREHLCEKYNVPNSVRSYFFVGDRNLSDIYDETYGPKKST